MHTHKPQHKHTRIHLALTATASPPAPPRPQNKGLAVAVLALDRHGRFGGRGTEADRFCYGVWSEEGGKAEMHYPPSWEEMMEARGAATP